MAEDPNLLYSGEEIDAAAQTADAFLNKLEEIVVHSKPGWIAKNIHAWINGWLFLSKHFDLWAQK